MSGHFAKLTTCYLYLEVMLNNIRTFLVYVALIVSLLIKLKFPIFLSKNCILVPEVFLDIFLRLR